jgi:hypothetical protein
MSEQEILDDYPELEAEDFRAAYEFAARAWANASRWETQFDENLSRKLVVRRGLASRC